MNEVELERIEETIPIEGAEDLLKELRRRGIKTGVLTRGCPDYADKALRIAGLKKYIDVVIARDRKSGILPKPSPQAAFAIMEKLGVDIYDAVMIGDYSIDFMCAQGSGIRFVGIVSCDRSKEDLVRSGCREFVLNLEEFGKLIGL